MIVGVGGSSSRGEGRLVATDRILGREVALREVGAGYQISVFRQNCENED